MNQDQRKSRHFLKASCLVAGLLSLAAFVLLIASSIEKVNAGRAADIYRTVWLLDFNWVAALILLIVSVVGLLGALWLAYLELKPAQVKRWPGEP
jgi:hypothetical protein